MVQNNCSQKNRVSAAMAILCASLILYPTVSHAGNVWRELLDGKVPGSAVTSLQSISTPDTHRATPNPWVTLDRRDGGSPRQSVVDLHQQIEQWSAYYGVPPDYLSAIMMIESDRFNPCSLSPAGAKGLMQIMPVTARHLSVSDPFRPEQAVRGGAAYLAEALTASNRDMDLAAAYYNFGPRALNVSSERWPGETRRYVSERLPAAMNSMRGENWRTAVPRFVPDVGVSDCRNNANTRQLASTR